MRHSSGQPVIAPRIGSGLPLALPGSLARPPCGSSLAACPPCIFSRSVLEVDASTGGGWALGLELG